MTTPRIPLHIQDSLRRVLDYLWDDEKANYSEVSTSDGRTERHIFDDLVELRTWSDPPLND